ncbi:GTP pyrophosphokinase [Vibrio crassostreae]|uniref:GTP pyrophosphokinase n=1 Tax=Vibrio crassostreae TaxID=246167 RepID=UPI001154EB08|nr:hypothetical protein [Vibrio crassostreae]TQK40586.1 ppGpp synthetase/RelA/SpoT-type nucleotidyltransferase [Vibrio crassostreae]
MKNNLIDWYIDNQPVYKRLSNKVESLLSEVFETSGLSYHQISSRTKTLDSVREKGSNEKYDDPINQIQDFSGVRIITYVESEIDSICKVIEDNFSIDTQNSSNKSDDLGIDKVGYKSVHYVAKLKKDRLKLPEYKQFENRHFEIQVRTILQHAWAEIEHDRNYKFSGKLPPDISRRFKILAGVLEMSDREFNQISQEIDNISEESKIATKEGNLNIPITSVSIAQYLRSKFESFLASGYDLALDHSAKGIAELERLGITTLEDFDKLITSDVLMMISLKNVSDMNSISELGTIRLALMLDDYERYFSTLYPLDYSIFTYDSKHEAEVMEFFEKRGMDWHYISEQYGVSLVPLG